MENRQNDVSLPINRAEALERIGGDPEFLQELLGIYSEEFLLRSRQLRSAVFEKSFSAIQDLGHTLKGSSANLSLPGLQKAAFDLEMAGREKNIQKAKDSLASLEREFERLKKFLARSPA
jgi:HPt (histidine-containing phosphotransfer) domain-containing protein